MTIANVHIMHPMIVQ